MEGAKTNRKRTFPCSSRWQEFLKSIHPSSPRSDDLVFSLPTNKLINYNNFCNNAWKRVVNPIEPGTMIQRHYADQMKLLSLRPID
jgi:integrase